MLLPTMTQLDLLSFIPFRLNRLAAEISQGLAGVYADRFGIDVAEWRVLATLGMHEPRSAQFIVRCTRTHKSKISRAVARLTEAGLVEGVPNAEDRRELPLHRTARGRELYEAIVPVVVAYERELLARLTEDELRGLVAGLDRLEQVLGLVQRADQCG